MTFILIFMPRMQKEIALIDVIQRYIWVALSRILFSTMLDDALRAPGAATIRLEPEFRDYDTRTDLWGEGSGMDCLCL